MKSRSTSNNSTPQPTPLTLTPPKLLLPTLATFLCTVLLCLLTYNPYIHSSSTSINTLVDMFHFALMPLTPALGLFLLYHLLRLAILHHAFHPVHLLSVATIILSAGVYYPVTALLITCVVFYLVAGIIFAASLAFQKKHSLAADPAHFRSSLISTSIASTILGFINLFILALQIIPTGLPYQISGPLFSNLISVSIIALLPLQLTLTFLVLTKLTTLKSTTSTSTAPKSSISTASSKPSASSHSANLLSRPNRLIICLSLLLTVTTFIAALAYFEHIITEEYSRRQPCCSQPVYYDE